MLKVGLATVKEQQEYTTGIFCIEPIPPDEPILVTQPLVTFNSVFKAVTREVDGTSIVAEPIPEASLLLVDMILTTDKVALASVTVRFTDDVNTINIITAAVNDAPVNLAINFGGRWQGWRDARIEFVTVNNVTATVACGYMKVKEKSTLDFADWDSRR